MLGDLRVIVRLADVRSTLMMAADNRFPFLADRISGPETCRGSLGTESWWWRSGQGMEHNLVSAITLDRDRAEDVVQDAFSGLHRNAHRVTNPGGYLQRSVVNLSIKVQRRRKVAGRYRPDRPPVSGIPEIDETWEAVCRLPARQRAVVALRYWEDLSEAQIASSLGWPAGTVKSTLHRALSTLKKEITR